MTPVDLAAVIDNETYFGFNLRVELDHLKQADPLSYGVVYKFFTRVHAARELSEALRRWEEADAAKTP